MNERNRILNTVFGRLVLGTVVLNGLLMPVAGYIALDLQTREMQETFINQSLAKTLVIASFAETSKDRGQLHNALDELVLSGHAEAAQILPLNAEVDGERAMGQGEDRLFRTVVRIGRAGGMTLVIDYDEAEAQERIQSLTVNGLVFFALLLLVSVIASSWFGWTTTASLRRLVDLTERLSREGAQAKRVPGTLQETRTLQDALFALRREVERVTLSMAAQQAIFDSTITGILTVSQSGMIETINQAVIDITGYGRKELQGRDLRALVLDHDRSLLESMLSGDGGHAVQDINMHHKSGHTVSVHVGFSAVEIEGERFHTLAIQDATAARELASGDYWITKDALTGLPNRSALLKYLASSVEFSRKNGLQGAVLFCDFDRFKEVNDTLGHAAGDLFLQEAARRFTQTLRAQDFVARFAGDEFVVVLNGLRNAESSEAVAQSLQRAFAESLQVGRDEMFAALSIGISYFPAHGEAVETLLHCADVAMYNAKREGGNGYSVFTSDDESDRTRKLQLETQLHRALENQEFRLVYQPIVDLNLGTTVGFEALLRWRHPLLGEISPIEFIPLCEMNGLIVPIGEWVLQTALQQGQHWRRSCGRAVRINVNLSGRQFNTRNLVQRFRDIMGAELEVPITLEITETSIVEAGPRCEQIMSQLRDAGFSLAIDDFGTGYSSLSYLSRFPVSSLKIDRSFTALLGAERDSSGIVGAVLAMGRSLGMEVVVEGLETDDQLQRLQALGARWAQGYLFDRPLEAAEAGSRLQQPMSRSPSLAHGPA